MSKGAESISRAFSGNYPLRKRIFDAIEESPQYEPLFEHIANYFIGEKHHLFKGERADSPDGQPSKKRKLENGVAASTATSSSQSRSVILEARDVSFSLPQRKKFHLSFVQYGQNFHAPTTTFAVCAINPATNQLEFEYPLSIFAHAVRLLVPEKATKQYNFCLIPSTQSPTANSPLAPGEGVIWTVNSGPLKSCTISSPELQEALSGSEDVLEKALDTILRRSNTELIFPTEEEFACALPEAHRKNEKAYHVKAHRGSKDGYLFFLSTGIFYAFKKPLLFFPFHEIDSVSYTAVLQRTFNLVVTVRPSPTKTTQPSTDSETTQEIEFSMLDQSDFAGIDAYIKKHGLQDASMAEARRAKQFKVNGGGNKSAGGGGGEGDDNEPGELAKAEQELEDEEDELEEDYDPGEDGDSDGSGDSEDDDDGDDDGEGGNLVEEELGSEAEDVEIDEEEEEEEDEDDEEDDVGGHVKNGKGGVTKLNGVMTMRKGPDPDDDDQL